MSDPVRIAMWSGPRNLSTAMMRSFGARADTFVSDEPFYGAYLLESGADHPMRNEVIASMETDWHAIASALSGPPPRPAQLWYQKHMAHHMLGPITPADLQAHRHAFLIRDPARVVASYAAKRDHVRPEDLGYARQRSWFDAEADRLGRAPPVIDSGDILANPAAALGALCQALAIPFDDAMLSWPPGRRDTDGIWASHWYASVEASTGFGPPEGPPPSLEGEAAAVADACRADFAYLAGFRLAPRPGAAVSAC